MYRTPCSDIYLVIGLHTAALITALFTQIIISPLAGDWIVFELLACAYMLRTKKDTLALTNITKLSLLYGLWLIVSTFFLQPVVNGNAFLWFLLIAPVIAVSMQPAFLRGYVNSTGAVIVLYALCMVLQFVFRVHYTSNGVMGIGGLPRPVWPILDPNNAAALLNIGLALCLCGAMRNKCLLLFVPVLGVALFLTLSKAGCIVAIGIIAATIIRYRLAPFYLIFGAAGFALCGLIAVYPFIAPLIENALDERFAIWKTVLPLWDMHPVSGIGSGQFSAYYNMLRKESFTSGFFAHNDILQIAIEYGLPAAISLCCLFMVVQREANFTAALIIGVILAHAQVEFQLYVPIISLILGTALAWGSMQPRENYEEEMIPNDAMHVSYLIDF